MITQEAIMDIARDAIYTMIILVKAVIIRSNVGARAIKVSKIRMRNVPFNSPVPVPSS